MGLVPKPARQKDAAPLPEPSQPPRFGAVFSDSTNNRSVDSSILGVLFSKVY